MEDKNVIIYNNSVSKILSRLPVSLRAKGNLYSYLNCDFLLEDIMWKLKNKNFTNPMLKLPKFLIPKINLICWTVESYSDQFLTISRTLGVKFKNKNE